MRERIVTYPGKLITVEGCDGSGKGELVKRLVPALRRLGHDVVLTKEPGNSNIGKTVRKLLFEKPSTKEMATGMADCLLLADHIGHVAQIVQPALDQGKWVVCDRYADSQFAYTVSRPGIEAINAAFWKFYGPVPDATILLTGHVPTLLARAEKRDDDPNAEEPGKQNGKAWARVQDQIDIQNAYLHNLAPLPRTLVINVDAKDTDQVFEETYTKLLTHLSTQNVQFQPALQMSIH